MKLGTNSACDLRAISIPPLRSGGGRASAPPASSAASAAGNLPQAVLLQQQTFSLQHPKLPRLSESEAFVDQTLHRPTPVRHQGFGLHDDSSKKMPPFPPSSASRAQEEPQQQQPVIMSKSTIPRWNPSPTDTRCRVNEDAERRFQQLSGSVDKAGMVLDSVQTDVIQLNRTMKEAALDSGTVQQKFDLLEDSLQKIIKGQNDLKVLAENITKSNPDQLNVLNSHTSKLNEMSLVVSVCPEQVQADLRQLHGDIFRVLTKDTEGVVRDIRSLSTRPAVMPMLPDQSFSPNERPQRNQVVVKGSPLINGMSVANGRPTMNRTPVANGRPLRNQTPVANGSPMIINRTPEGNGRSQLKQTPVTNGTPQRDLTPEMNGRPRKDQIPVANGSLPARSTFATRASVLRPNVEQGMVKAAHMVGTSHRLAPTQKEVLNQKVNPQEPTKKEPVKIIIGSDNDSKGCTSQVILNMEPADLMKEAGSESDAQFVWGARKRTENEMLSIDAATLLPGEGEKRRQGPAPEARKGEAVHAVEAAPAKRAHRRNPKYDATEWITC